MSQFALFMVLLISSFFIDIYAKVILKILNVYEEEWGKIKSLIWCIAGLLLIAMLYWILAGYLLRWI